MDFSLEICEIEQRESRWSSIMCALQTWRESSEAEGDGGSSDKTEVGKDPVCLNI